MLKNLMEENQLDFNAPLLSVRRFSAEGENSRAERSQPKNLIPPSYRSALKSGPVCKAGTVPFRWEQIPGKPKDGEGSSPKPLERTPLAPKLPPGRILDVKPSVKFSEDIFCENSLNLDRSFESSPSRSNVCSHGSSSLAMPLPAASLEHKGVIANEVSDTEDCDAFSDALETLSLSESVFHNFSLSGLSGWDNPHMKPVDPQSQRFMMDRFLPAANAMASENHQHISRKQPIAHESVIGMNGVKREDDGPFSYHAESNFVPKYSPEERDGEDEEEDGEDADYDDTGNLSSKTCGLFPQSLRKSLCLLNPVFCAPGPKVRRQMRLPSAPNKSNLRAKVSDHGSLRDTDEKTWEAIYKHKLIRKVQTNGLPEDGSKRTTESTSTCLGTGADRLTYWSYSETPDGSSPYRPSTGGISPYRSDTPQSPFHEGACFLGFPKQDRNLKGVDFNRNHEGFSNYSGISGHGSTRSPGSGSLTEKTVHVDFVQMLQRPNLRSDSLENGELMLSSEFKDSETQMEVQRSQESLSIGDSIVDKIDHLDIAKASETSNTKISESGRDQPFLTVEEDNLPSCPDRSNLTGKLDMETSDIQQPVEVEIQGNSFPGSSKSLPPPPLPKSPSESWLLHTFSGVSTPKPSLRSLLGVQHHSSITPSRHLWPIQHGKPLISLMRETQH